MMKLLMNSNTEKNSDLSEKADKAILIRFYIFFLLNYMELPANPFAPQPALSLCDRNHPDNHFDEHSKRH
jgi:hypothetical protein